MSMPRLLTRFASSLSVLSLAAVGTLPALAERTRDVDLSHPLGTVTILEIDDVNGSIVATPSAGRTITIHAHASTSGADPGTVVGTSLRGNRLVICAVFPGSDASRDCSQHHNYGSDDHVRIDLTVGVPSGVRVVANNVDGSTSVTGLDAPVQVSGVSGAVEISTRDTASASTVNGAISAQFSGRGDARFNTVNGTVSLTVPRDADATFRAQTLDGAISSAGVHLDTRNGEYVGHSATAILGAGHGRISVHTVNGTVRLERR